ncbi:MAG: hypothetical protein ACI4T3_04650 [Lactobacillus sp.]
MEINFDFLKDSKYFSEQYSAANKIYKLYTIDDYRDVISNSRLLLETIVKKIFPLENLNQYYPIKDGEYRNLRNDTHYLRSEVNYPLSIMDLFDEVRRMGNAAIHDAKIEPNKKQAWRCICDLHDILVFLINSYENKDLYYIRPDISMEAQTDEKHYFARKSKNVNLKHIKLSDHKTAKKKTNQHQNRRQKKAKHYSSTSKKESKDNVQPTRTDKHKQKENLFTKIKRWFN